jgi:hypothetical protein
LNEKVNSMPKRKLVWTIVAVLAVGAALTGIAENTGQHYADDALKRALVTFAVARTLNGAISVAQGTELALEPGGIGVVLSIGQVLDPVNDLVERFSGVMLVAASSIGLQNILLRITAWWGVTLVLIAASVYALAALWWPGLPNSQRENTAIRLLLAVIFVRFAMPLLVIGTALIFDAFLAGEQDAATQALRETQAQVEQLDEEPLPPETEAPAVQEQSLIDRGASKLKEYLDSASESLVTVDPKEKLEQLRERASEVAADIINLIAIFVFQTVLLPLAFLWLFVQGLKSIAARATRL